MGFAAIGGANAGERAWAAVSTPAAGPPRVIGRHANGCIGGAAALPLDGAGYTVIRPQRNRFWGHPVLISFVKDLGRHVRKDTGRVLMIADMGQPRGGPASSHASHQSGLDVDIRLRLLTDARLDPATRRDPPEISALTPERTALDPAVWTPAHIRLVRAAASHRAVDRVFVHPVIKRALCRTVTGERRWLRRVRPWYGHHAHMHVRLACPPGSPGCVPPGPLPPGNGCGKTLDWWFSDEPYRKKTKPRPRPGPPAACQTVLAD